MTHKQKQVLENFDGLEVAAYLAWRDGKPCYEGDDAVCENAVWPVDNDDDRASMPVVTLTSAQAAVAAERKRWEDATLAIKAIGDANADSDCARITALESALGVAREALILYADNYGQEDARPALLTINQTLK